MADKGFIVNLKNPEDSPEKIAQKLNTLAFAIDESVIRGAVTRKEFEALEKKTKQFIESAPERVKSNLERGKMSDQRYHGGGLSAVSHDITLSGDGTAANPLKVVGGAGTVTSVSVVSANGLAGTVASATSTPSITLSTSVTGILKGDGTSISAASDGTDYISGTLASSTYLPLSVATATYLPLSVATSVYLPKSLATATYLPLSVATATYLPISVATSTYLPLSVATATYLPLSVATSTYLPISVATATYLSQSLATATYLATAVASNTYVTPTSTNTLTNKRITRRVTTIASGGAVPSYNTDNCDVLHIYGQAAAITSFTSGASGTPVDGDMFRISVLATASAALTFGTNFEASTVALPTTTSGTSRLDVGFVYNTETGKWRCVATA